MAKSNIGLNKIYMDYASATPIDPRVLAILSHSQKVDFSNAGAIHDLGVELKRKLENARAGVASILGSHKDEVIFTSGATESNNLAILGILNESQNKNTIPHIVTTNIEHASVLEVCKYLEKNKKAKVTYVEVEENGIVDPLKIKKALKPNTVLVSVMYANNEIGTIQSIREIAKEIRHYNKFNSLGRSQKTGEAKNIIFHTDATQAINYLPIKIEKLGIDLMSFNSAKIYGPKGVGVLFKKRNISFDTITHGGNQEFGFRPGTENVPAILALVEALKITEEMKDKEVKRITTLRDYFLNKLFHTNILTNIIMKINGDIEKRLPNNINITIPKIPSDLLVIELSARGVMASAKSACKSGDGKASHVITAINKKINEIDGSLRFSLGRGTTKAGIDFTFKSLREIIKKLEKWYI